MEYKITKNMFLHYIKLILKLNTSLTLQRKGLVIYHT